MEKIDRKSLLILGFSSSRVTDARRLLSELRGFLPGVEVQLMRADRIAGKEHLFFAVDNALRAFRQNYRRSRSLGMEILLYASGQRQISKAIEMLGITPRTKGLAVVGLSDSQRSLTQLPAVLARLTGGKEDPRVLEVDSQRKLSSLRKTFGITERELKAARVAGEKDGEVVRKLVIEKSALLALAG